MKSNSYGAYPQRRNRCLVGLLFVLATLYFLFAYLGGRAVSTSATTVSLDEPIIVLGGGPTGLGAAWRLHELGHRNWRVLERNATIGGLSGSFTDKKGFIWDLGGHVYFSHYEYFTKLYDKLVPQFQENDREAYVRVNQTWVPYPFQNNLRYLPQKEAMECLETLEAAQSGGRARYAHNFGEFVQHSFGRRISEIFMRPYNFKVWAHPVEMLNKEWIGERVAVIDTARARRNVLEKKDDFGWGPNSRFKYSYYGTQELFDRLIAKLPAGSVRTEAEVVAIDVETRRVELASGDSLPYARLLSTMPLDRLIGHVIRGPMPDAVRWAATHLLRHSNVHIVGVGVRGRAPRKWSWLYFPEPDSPFYRVTYLSNYSPKMVPQDGAEYYSCMAEVSFSEFKHEDATSVVQRVIDGLVTTGVIPKSDVANIVSTWHKEVYYAYPTVALERDAALALVLPWLEKHGIRSRGRFGLWRYEVANTDHTTMQGVEAVNNWLLGEPEVTAGTVYAES